MGSRGPITAQDAVGVAAYQSRFEWETQKGGSSSRNLCTLCCARAASLPIWGFFRRFGGERKERLLGRVALSFLPGCGRLSNGQDQFQREEGRGITQVITYPRDRARARAIFFPCGKFHIRQLRESLLPKWGQSGFASGSLALGKATRFSDDVASKAGC